jgi:hypothetical protein
VETKTTLMSMAENKVEITPIKYSFSDDTSPRKSSKSIFFERVSPSYVPGLAEAIKKIPTSDPIIAKIS